MADPEDDLSLQRTSSTAVKKVLKELPRLKKNCTQARLRSVIDQLEPFQGDPQLLDVHLKNLVPPVFAAYLEQTLGTVQETNVGELEKSAAFSKILYTLCKIRGEGPIVGFFNNEPRYLEPVVRYFEDQRNGSMAWEEKYILLLWLSHLTLTPFDLRSISSQNVTTSNLQHLSLPASTPPIAIRMLSLALSHLQASSREMKAAARLLARLSSRSDMRSIGLLQNLVLWALDMLKGCLGSHPTTERATGTEQNYLGTLVFLGYLVSSSTIEIGRFVPQIYGVCQLMMEAASENVSVASTALAKKAITKLLRNIVLVCLSPHSGVVTDESMIIEEVIGYLLESLADKDTPVRIATSKALSVITLKLHPEMAAEVVQSLLESFSVNVTSKVSAEPDLSHVDAAQWHGLTLTLAQLLFRRAPPNSQLPEILRLLFLALNFEQRTSTGVSIGANVRDAANFGIWSLSRRYTIQELAAIDTSSFDVWTEWSGSMHKPKGNGSRAVSMQQLLATQLLISACLDPSGNIRRGSSAALQELVGRHPDTIFEGISLVQIVDYHAVGLRERAMIEVSASAAALGDPDIYLRPLFRSLLGWRGVRSGDVSARTCVANAVGQLSTINADGLFEAVVQAMDSLEEREVERRHGILLCLAALIDQRCDLFLLETDDSEQRAQRGNIQSVLKKSWSLFTASQSLRLSNRDFTAHNRRPELTTVAVAALIRSLSRASAMLSIGLDQLPNTAEILQLVSFCLSRFEGAALNVTPIMVRALTLMSEKHQRTNVVRSWLAEESKGNSRIAVRQNGYILALGSAFPHLEGDDELQKCIIDRICRRIGPEVDVEARVVALRSLKCVLIGRGKKSRGNWRTEDPTPILPSEQLGINICQSILNGLNDYTINERGDVGSLVRLQALDTVEAFPLDFGAQPSYETLYELILAATRRVSVEKLDRVRLKASQTFGEILGDRSSPLTLQDVSSYEHFYRVLHESFWASSGKVDAIVFEGLVSSTGGGASEDLLQSARAALVDVLCYQLNDPLISIAGELVDICTTFTEVLRTHLDDERVLVPLLDTIGFLFDAEIMQKLRNTAFKWRTLLSLVQKSHFKSSNIPKILAAISCYRGLAEIDSVREDVLKKLRSMLKHPFPKVRDAAAEALFLITNDDELRGFTNT